MDYEKLSNLLFPDVTKTPEEIENIYPPRQLPEGAKVTRFAPSPTGFVHFGGLFPSMVSERLAHQSNGIFYLRIEDTDSKREVQGAKEGLIKTLKYYGIYFDEGATESGDNGNYGPYTQSQRRNIYRVYAKKLVKEAKAYPVFTTKAELELLNSQDKKEEIKTKDWHEDNGLQKEEMLKSRNITLQQVEDHLKNGDPFVLRMLSNGDPEKKFKFTDLVKGQLELPENDRDEVLLKSDGMPSYHFAHAIDDHLMGTTHVIRGDEWLSSLPRHIMLFSFLGFKIPKYAHISPIMRLDENGNKKKLSKRDMGANMEDYRRLGYTPECVTEYIMTLLNSNYEEWHSANKDKKYTDFQFNIKKMSTSGCLFDINKLNDVSKNTLSLLSADKVYNELTSWCKEFDIPFYELLIKSPEYSKSILNIGRGGKKPRKDLSTLADAKEYMGFFFDEIFSPTYTYPANIDSSIIIDILNDYQLTYDENDDQNIWFDKVKNITEKYGFASDMKDYKLNPSAYKGSISDVAMILRVAITGKTMSPDTFYVMKIMGKQRVLSRLNKAKGAL